jgi:hypothetical protein
VKYFQNEPKWPEIPEHLRESAEKRHKYPSGFMSEALPLLVEPRLRAEAVEYLRQVEQWRAKATVKIGDSIFRAHVGIDYAKGPDRTVVTKHEPSPFDFGPCTGCGKLTMNSGASGKRCWYCQYKPNTARLSAYIWALPEAATPDATVLPPAEGSAYTATGDRLDALGAMVRVFRDPMQSDEDYRATLIRYTGWAQ